REARTWLEVMLERTDATDRNAARGQALLGAGWLDWAEGGFAEATPRAEESLSILRETGDKRDRACVVETARRGLVRTGPSGACAVRDERQGRVELAVGDILQVAIAQYHDAH